MRIVIHKNTFDNCIFFLPLGWSNLWSGSKVRGSIKWNVRRITKEREDVVRKVRRWCKKCAIPRLEAIIIIYVAPL